jgi:putative transposase
MGETMALDKDLIDKLLGDYQKPEDLIGENGLLKQLTKALVERALNAELTHHLGYEKSEANGRGSGNSRNGTSRKKLTGDFGEVEIEVPRDREGDFEPQIVGKHQRRFTGFDDKILSMYARGMSTREIQGHLQEIYGAEISPSLISEVTDAVIDEVEQWRSRPLEPIYAIIYLDALYVKMRHEGRIENRAVYVAIGVRLDGLKEVLGLWTVDKEGSKSWMTFMTGIRNRGVQDVFIVCIDGLKGFPEAIEAVYPKALVQLCIVHILRNCLNYVNWKQRKEVAADLRAVYTAPTAEAAEQELKRFGEKWDKTYGAIRLIWERHWDRIIPFFAFAPEIRKVMYTTNAIESLNMSLRKIIKTRGSFPSEQAAIKLLYLALKNVSAKWQRNRVTGWAEALNQFTLLWSDRIQAAARVPNTVA